MKTTVIAGRDNAVFTSADLLNPAEMKLIGYGTTIEEAWNVFDEDGKGIKDEIEDMPIMPVEAAIAMEPDCIVVAAQDPTNDEQTKYLLYKAGYRGEVISLYDEFRMFAPKTAAIRKIAWRLDWLGVEGAAADLGAWKGDISWQMNALMPERKLYIFDTFTGYDERDIATEQREYYSESRAHEYSMSRPGAVDPEEYIMNRMPYKNQVIIKKGWFPETAFDLEDEKYALVHIDAGLYEPTFKGIQYFYPRMSKGGVIIVTGYEDGQKMSVRAAIEDLEAKYGAFLITPLIDNDGSIMITKP